MAGLPPGDPQLVSMIVNHLKTQGLFDQFRRDCLADVDTKPAYLNLKQRVDNFVSNHLSNHTWSPHLNKNQLRNNIRQLVLQSGMLEQGVDRIVAQVVDPKINHTFRPQVERVVREFLSPGCYVEEPAALPVLDEEKPAHNLPEQASSSAPTGDAMSILETITTLNQEASSWASSSGERNRKGGLEEPIQELEEGEQDMNVVEEGEENQERTGDEEPMLSSDFHAMEVKKEDVELPDSERERLTEEMKTEDEESGTPEQADEGKDKFDSKTSGTPKEEGQALDVDPLRSPSEKHHMKQKARERLKEEYSLEDSDLEGLSDITVSSVHTSDLSSFEEESDDDLPPSDSSEDGEVSSDGDKEEKKQTCTDNEEDKERKPRRQAYVHKPFLYSRYYSDSDDEVTVEQRRRSAAKDKEERLLKRQQNRERMEEKRKQRAAQLEEQNKRRQETASLGLEGPRAKEARKERKVLEKKMALSRKRKRDSRKEGEAFIKKKGDSECEYTKKEEGKAGPSKSLQPKSTRKVSESASLDERRRRKSGSTSEDSVDPRKADRSRTHSFILDLEHGSEESLKQRPAGKFDRLSRKELHPKERKDKERSLSGERAKLKQKPEKREAGDGEESLQKELKVASDDKGEKKIKVKSDKRSAGTGREGRAFVSESLCEEASHKDMKKGKAAAVDAAKVDKEREKDKEKGKEKDKAKEKDKMKGEKASMKSDLRPLLRDSAGSSEERSDMEPGADGIRRREKPPKDVLKRSRSHNEDTEKTRQVEKGKIRSEAKDGEKEKPKGDDGTQDSQKSVKASSEPEKDPRRSKEEQAAKGKATEKCRSKSKEDVKVPSSSKVDKKVQSADARTKGGTPTGKPDTLKDRKKDMGGKAHRRGSEENLAERNEDKSSKKPEKKIKILEKKGESQEEAKGVRGDDRSDKSSTPSVSSPVLETPESSRTSPQPKDACADPDPSVAIVTPSVLDDTYDALSDITPEPDDEDDAVKRLSEVEPSLPAPEANALLTLMDICTSEDARLVSVTDAAVAVQGGQAEDAEADGGQPLPELAFQDADLKMKEAALTLLSMDPESIVSSSVATQKEAAPAPQQVETAPSEGGDWHGSVHVQEVVEHPAEEGTQEMHVPVTEPEREDASSAEVTEMVISNVQPLDELGQQKNVSPNEEKVNHTNVTPDKPEESLSVDSGTLTTATEKEHDSNVEEATEEMVVEPIDPKIMIESEDTNKDQEETLEEKDAPVAGKCLPLQPEEVRETRRGRPSKLQKQTSNASKSDGQEDEKESDLSEKEGRGTRKRKLSNQKTGMPKDSAEENKEQETQEDPSPESVEESDIEKAQEPTARRRGRSSKASVDEDDQPAEQPEKVEETRTRRGRRSGAPAKETPASGKTKEKKDEEKAGGASTEKPQEKEEKATEKIEPKKPGRRGRPPKAQAQAQATEKAEKSESKETAGVCKPSRKRKRSEEREETSEETQPDEKEVLDGESQPQEENLPQEVTESQSEDQEDRKQEGSSETKTDKVEEDKDKPQKKPGRRGRPSKGADVTQEDPEKKDKPDGKEGEAKEEEEGDEEDEEEEGEEGGTKRRTTTRLAARLEAERNKPSKPSTRASRLGGKEESATSTRGTRGQAVVAAAKGGRKREASPPAPRTRGGQKLEEPPSKRAKR